MTLSKCFSALTILGVLALSAPARADIPPDDQCFAADVGKACQNAMGDGTRFQPGVCQETLCTRATPDGSMTYSCYRCLAEDGGAGGQPNEGGGSAGAPVNPPGGMAAGGTASGGSSASSAGTKSGSAGSTSDSNSSDDGGCSVSQAGGGAGALGTVLVAFGLAVAGLRRRRSSAS